MAADGHTPGLLQSALNLDSNHSRLVNGKLNPVPDDIFINMGENSGPADGDVEKVLKSLRRASSKQTNIFVLIPFSGRSRQSLSKGFTEYVKSAPLDKQCFLMDLGNSPYLPVGRPTVFSVDGQHPLSSLHALLGAQIIAARSQLLKH
jgi:hypothetical protein